MQRKAFSDLARCPQAQGWPARHRDTPRGPRAPGLSHKPAQARLRAAVRRLTSCLAGMALDARTGHTALQD